MQLQGLLQVMSDSQTFPAAPASLPPLESALASTTTTTVTMIIDAARKAILLNSSNQQPTCQFSVESADGRWDLMVCTQNQASNPEERSMGIFLMPAGLNWAELSQKRDIRRKVKCIIEVKHSHYAILKRNFDHEFILNVPAIESGGMDGIGVQLTSESMNEIRTDHEVIIENRFLVSCQITETDDNPLERESRPSTISWDKTMILASAALELAETDVCFAFKSTKQDQPTRYIHAHSRILKTVPYFKSLLGESFSEGSPKLGSNGAGAPPKVDVGTPSKIETASDLESTPEATAASEQPASEVLNTGQDTSTGAEPASLLDAVPEAAKVTEEPAAESVAVKQDGTTTCSLDEMEDSDCEDEDNYGLPASAQESFKRPPTASEKVICITDFGLVTYFALVIYMSTGNVLYTPLRSSYAAAEKRALEKGKKDFSRKKHVEEFSESFAWDDFGPYPTSPKSLFRLADSELGLANLLRYSTGAEPRRVELDIAGLRKQALREVAGQLNAHNAIQEMSSPVFRILPDLMDAAVTAIAENWTECIKTDAFTKAAQAGFYPEIPVLRDAWAKIWKSLPDAEKGTKRKAEE